MAKRIQWKEYETSLPTEKLVFWDESGINIGMVRQYGRTLGGKCVVDHSPLNTPKKKYCLWQIDRSTTTAADKIARVLEAEAVATQAPTYPA